MLGDDDRTPAAGPPRPVYADARPRSVTDFASHGNTTLGAAELQTALDSIAPTTTLVVPDRTTVDCGSTQIVVNQPVTLMSDWRGGLRHSSPELGTNAGLLVKAHNVTLRGLKLTGPGGAAYTARQHGIHVEGVDNGEDTAPTPIRGLNIVDLDVVGWGSSALYLDKVTAFEATRFVGRTCGYGGILGMHVSKGRLEGVTIKDLTSSPGGSEQGNQYGIQWSARTRTDDRVRFPAPSDIEVSGFRLEGIPTWDGVGTHGGRNLVFADGVMNTVGKAVEFAGLTGASAATGTGPVSCLASDIKADTGTRDGWPQAAVVIAGIPGATSSDPAVSYAVDCAVVGGSFAGYGTQDNPINGGAYLRSTLGLTLRDLAFIECGPSGVCLFYDNRHFYIDNVTGYDVWSGALGVTAVVMLNASNNQGRIGHLRAIRSTRAVPARPGSLLSHGIYAKSADAGTDVVYDGSADLGDAGTAVGGASAAAVARLRRAS